MIGHVTEWTRRVTLTGMTNPGNRGLPIPVSPAVSPWALMNPPPRPVKKGMPTWEILVCVIGGVVGLILITATSLWAFGVHVGVPGPAKPTYDVIGCQYDGFATTLEYEITNNDTRPHEYWVEGRVGHSPTLPDVLENVAPGERVTGKMIGVEQGGCAITSVQQR